MTELLTRPPAAAVSSKSATAQPSSLWWRGSLAALWAVALGVAVLMVTVLIVWATDSRSGAGAGQALRAALQLWLIAHKVPLHLGRETLAVAPLGLTCGLAFLVARAAAVLARSHDVQSPVQLGSVALAVGIPYGVLAAFVAAAATSSVARPSPVAALGAGLLLGCGAAGWGAVRGTGSGAVVLDRLPRWLADGLRGAAASVALLVVAGFALTLGSLGVHASAAADTANLLGGGLIAKFALLAADALLLPNAALTTLGYLSGPGFAVGAGTSVTVAASHVHAMPALPLLAAVPHGGASSAVRATVVVTVLAAGAVLGWRATRMSDSGVWGAVARAAAGAGGAGVLAAALVALAGGPAGSGRMAAVGASPWQVGLALTGELGVVAVVTAAVAGFRR
jgi:hypothetical protein